MNEEEEVLTSHLTSVGGLRIYKGQPFTGVEVSNYDHVGKNHETHYKNGKMDGRYVWYDVYGRKGSEINYKNGKMDGLHIWKDKNENLKNEEYYKEDKQHGPYISWYENGQKEIDANYKDGELDGSYISWYENGQKKLDKNYKNGKLEGVFTSYYDNGQKEYQIIINGGVEEVCFSWNEFGHRTDFYRWEKWIREASFRKSLMIFGLFVGVFLLIASFLRLPNEFTFVPRTIPHYVCLIGSLLFGGLCTMKQIIGDVRLVILSIPLSSFSSSFTHTNIRLMDVWKTHKWQIVLVSIVFSGTSFPMYIFTYAVLIKVLSILTLN
jgi:antitoxin component YwqK of YwqJK toxin-antitoxin module